MQLPEMMPGQFVQIEIPDSKTTFLRRPISICNVDTKRNELWLLVRDAGAGTHSLINTPASRTINVVLPLGNGFSTDLKPGSTPLLIGGGVGVAPMLYLGKYLQTIGIVPRFLLGARSEADLLLLDEFEKTGDVYVSTDDGSRGTPGIITLNPVLESNADIIYCCGPSPMMKAVASIARERMITCEVSLENMMACGLGACLCCVEKTVKGNTCVCTDGPVFNINQLLW